MEVKPGLGSPLIDVVSKLDYQGKLAVGDQVRVRVLSVQGSLAVISLLGQEIVVSTELLLEPGMLVTLLYAGISAEGKHTFRLVEEQAAVSTPTGSVAYGILRQFGLEPNPELISRLEAYLRAIPAREAAAAAGTATLQEDSLPTRQSLERPITEFALLVKMGIPLNSTNLRIWRQFWQEPVLPEALTRLLLVAEDHSGEPRERLLQLVDRLCVPVDAADPQDIDPQNLKQHLTKWLKPNDTAEAPAPADAADTAWNTEELHTDARILENAVIRLAEQFSALRTVNTASQRFCSPPQPLYFLIPIAQGTNAYTIEMLVDDQQHQQKRTPPKQQALRLTLAIPTCRLGRIIAVITMRAESLALELISALPETVSLLGKHLEHSELKQVFQSIRVRLQPLDKLEPKNRLLELVKQQISPQVDLRI